MAESRVYNTSLVYPCPSSHWRLDSFPAPFPGMVQLGEDFPLSSLSKAGEDALVNPPQYIVFILHMYFLISINYYRLG